MRGAFLLLRPEAAPLGRLCDVLSSSEEVFPNSRSAGVYPRRGTAIGLTIRPPGIKPGATTNLGCTPTQPPNSD